MIPFSRSFKEKPNNFKTLKGFDIANSVGKLSSYLSVLDFLKSVFHEIDFLTWFFVYLKLDFTACVACKNQVPNRQKIKSKNQFRKIEIWKKSRTDR